MGQAEHASTTRRALLAHGLAVTSALVGTAAFTGSEGAGRPEHPDAALLRLQAELDTAWAGENAVREAMKGLWTLDNESIIEDAVAASQDVIDRIVATPAKSLDGLRVKARAVSWCYAGEPVEAEADLTTSETLMASLVNDLLAMTERPLTIGDQRSGATS